MAQNSTPARELVWFPLPRTQNGRLWLGGLLVFGALLACGWAQDILGAPDDTNSPEYKTWSDHNDKWVFLIGVAVPLAPVAAFWLVRLLFLATSHLHSLWRERAERLRAREEQRELLLTDRVNALHLKVRENQAALRAMAKETQEVAGELEEYLRERLALIDELSARVADNKVLSEQTPEMLAAFNKAIDARFHRERRSGLRAQVVFLVIAFALGFVVNWLSNPALDMLHHLAGR